jgi:hypothetical protein
MPEAEASVDGPTPPTVPLEGLATTMEHVRVDPTTLPPLSGGGPGLVLVAGAGDDLATLYAKVYRGVKPPPYPTVIAANRMPVRPGALVIFPEPPEGWSQR